MTKTSGWRKSNTSRSPISSLPPELLGTIFIYSIFASYIYPFKLDRRAGVNPYDVILVSRLWRDVAYLTPQLWIILPGYYPQLWETIVKRSGSLPLHLQWHKKVPKSRNHQTWPLEILEDPNCYGRLQGLKLKLKRCWELKSLAQLIVPSYSLRHVHIAEHGGKQVWDDWREFSTFVQGLPHLTYLGLEGNCIPLGTSSGTTQEWPKHPKLRRVWLKGETSRVFRFLEFAPLRKLESLDFQAECARDVSEVTEQDLQRVFQDFWKGRDVAPRSLALSPSGSNLEIIINQCRAPGGRTECGTNAPLLKLTVTGFNGISRGAWKRLINALPSLPGVEELILRDVRIYNSEAERLLRLAPQTKRIVATGLYAKFLVWALKPGGVATPATGETLGEVDRGKVPDEVPCPRVDAPLLESLTLEGVEIIPRQDTDVSVNLLNLLFDCVRKRRSLGHGLKRLTVHGCGEPGPAVVADLSSEVDSVEIGG